MNNIESNKLYKQLESSANQALIVKNPEEFAEAFITNIAKVLATHPRLEGLRENIAATGKSAVTEWTVFKAKSLKKLQELIKPLLIYELKGLSFITQEYAKIQKADIDIMILDISFLLEKSCNVIINDYRWNPHHDHTQILMPLVKFDEDGKAIFIFHHVLEDYHRARQQFYSFTENSVFDSFNKIISTYKARGLVTFIGQNSQTLNIKACNMSLQHVLPSIKEYLFSQKDISSYDKINGILYDNGREFIFRKNQLPSKILSLFYPNGKPAEKPLSFEDIYDISIKNDVDSRWYESLTSEEIQMIHGKIYDACRTINERIQIKDNIGNITKLIIVENTTLLLNRTA